MIEARRTVRLPGRTGLTIPLKRLSAGALVALLAAVAGAVATTSHGIQALEAAAGLGVVAIALRYRLGAFIALLILAAEDGLPFLSTETHRVAGSPLTVWAAAGIPAIALVHLATTQQRQPSRIPRFILWASVAVASVWVLAVLRATSAGVPYRAAALFGKDFLIFAAVLPSALVLTRSPKVIRDILGLVVAAAALYSVGAIAIVTTGASLPWLVHAVAVRTTGAGLARVYAYMIDATVLAFALMTSRALVHPVARARVASAVLAGLFLVAILLSETRALYLSLPAALALGIGACLVAVPSVRKRLGKRGLVGLVALLLATLVLLAAAPALVSKYGATSLTSFARLRANSIPDGEPPGCVCTWRIKWSKYWTRIARRGQ